MVGAAFFCANLPELRASVALASIAVILERDGGVEGWRAGVLALDPTGVEASVFEGAGGGLGSVPTRMDPVAVLAAEAGEGTGEE